MQPMNVPMVLTLSRLVLAPVFFLLFELAALPRPWAIAGAWLVFWLIEVSDLLDGYLARKLRQETEAGKVLDPLADSLSRLTYFLCYTVAGIMPAWVLLVLVYRDIAVSYIRVLFSRAGVMLPARTSGKAKAWVYAFAGGFGLADFSLRVLDIFPRIQEVVAATTFVLFLAAAGAALWSLGDYGLALLKAGPSLKKKKK
jgi:CDP-diacylglycerol--glycerol-3-phosphate 3-phosphatidyltransferase